MLWLCLHVIVTLTLTAHDVQSAECNVGEYVERLAAQLHGQFASQDGALLVENINEIIQDFEMKGGRQNLQLSMKYKYIYRYVYTHMHQFIDLPFCGNAICDLC